MSWRDAPIYIEAHDLARWLLERANTWQPPDGRHLAPVIAQDACELLSAVSLALTFPATRAAHLETADNAIVRLRVVLRLARDVGLVSAGGLRYASGRLQVIGRMVGGWRKRMKPIRPWLASLAPPTEPGQERHVEQVSGSELPPARIG